MSSSPDLETITDIVLKHAPPIAEVSFSTVLGNLTCNVTALMLSGVATYRHLIDQRDRKLQRYIVRMLLIVPVIAFENLTYLTTGQSFMFKVAVVIRDLWEAVTIDTFLNFILELGGGEEHLSEAIEEFPGEVEHMLPNFMMPPDGWNLTVRHGGFHTSMNHIFESIGGGRRRRKKKKEVVSSIGDELQIQIEDHEERNAGEIYFHVPRVIPCNAGFVSWCKKGTLQFVVAKPLMAILFVLVSLAGYSESPVWTAFQFSIYNLTYSVALYALVLFYRGVRDQPRIKNLHPLRKFLAIKAIVFVTFWQALPVWVVQVVNNWMLGYGGRWGEDCQRPSPFAALYMDGNIGTSDKLAKWFGASCIDNRARSLFNVLLLGWELPILTLLVIWAYPRDEFHLQTIAEEACDIEKAIARGIRVQEAQDGVTEVDLPEGVVDLDFPKPKRTRGDIGDRYKKVLAEAMWAPQQIGAEVIAGTIETTDVGLRREAMNNLQSALNLTDVVAQIVATFGPKDNIDQSSSPHYMGPATNLNVAQRRPPPPPPSPAGSI